MNKNTSTFSPANILIPKENLNKWSVVACDQYTSEKEYWKETQAITNGYSSALNIVFPEIYLEDEGFEQRIDSINGHMRQYLDDKIFNLYSNALIYVERTLGNGKVRKGVVGKVDLEKYDFSKGSQSAIRATEGTVLERIPPRVKIRQNAVLECPHIMLLIDDGQKAMIEPLAEKKQAYEKVYDFALMQGGGHIAGYLMNDQDMRHLLEQFDSLGDEKVFEEKYGVQGKGVLQFAAGDGNHSLATARQCYLNLKEEIGEEAAMQSPARYALCEIVNLHDESLEFEAIHRVVFGVDPQHMLNSMEAYFAGQGFAQEKVEGKQSFHYLYNGAEGDISLKEPKLNLTVGSLQAFLDEYLAENGGKVDYIHGEDVVRKLGAEPGNIGFLLPCMGKDELFSTVILDGALPRKTFSMGEAADKRFYLECRKIK